MKETEEMAQTTTTCLRQPPTLLLMRPPHRRLDYKKFLRLRTLLQLQLGLLLLLEMAAAQLPGLQEV